MNKIKIFLSSILLMSNYSCYSGVDYFYTLDPIYISSEKFKSKIVLIDPKEIKELGKIYTYKNYLFVNEKNVGVHIYDNKNPKLPINKYFLRIPFNEDISIKNDTLYSDSLGQIISIDISNIENNKIEVLDKIDLHNTNLDNKIKVGYKRSGPYFKSNFTILPSIGVPVPATTDIEIPVPGDSNKSYSNSSPQSEMGKGGSLARFSIVGDYLYTVDDSNLNLFNIKDSKKIESMGYVKITDTQDIETIYPYQDKLFMGSMTGTYIYDNKNPLEPSLITKVAHTKSCDPVVVENNEAYVTLRAGTRCSSGDNRLDIINLSDIKNSKVVKSYPLNSPSGLAVDNKKLFICDADSLKVLDVTDLENITEINKYNLSEPKDIILTDKKEGIVVAKDGLHQFDLSDPKNKITEISNIKVENNSSLFDLFEIELTSLDENNSNLKEKYIREGRDIYYKWYKEYFSDIK